MNGVRIWSLYDGKKDVIMRYTTLALGFAFFTGLSACGEMTSVPAEPVNSQTKKQELKETQKSNFEQGKASLDDKMIARIGPTYLYQSDVERLALERDLIETGEKLLPTDERFQMLLDELIDQRLLAMEAVQRSVDQTSENKRRLAAARERILSNILIETHLREEVTEANILRLYNEQAALANRGNELRARHIVVKSKDEAQEILNALEAGGDFAALAFERSIDKASKDKGGDLGWITRDRLAPDLTQILYNTATGDRTKPFQTVEGWHVAEVMQRRAPKGQDFETVQPKIRSFLTYDAIQSLLEDLRKKNEVETFFIEVDGDPKTIENGNTSSDETSPMGDKPQEDIITDTTPPEMRGKSGLIITDTTDEEDTDG